ncbi:uncharacterized protein LOC125028715 [Penaeus chinensis]|uniref:uncharacterized protein LOC125028715 n=1 Tax=Penaeus chinensis TaxID=139456 RepID=UPI001FB616C7|nr:uncharacterized protein LOC125028715 [Penaeus chinensis]
MSSKAKFQDAWLTKPEFQPWLARDDGDSTRAYCTLCKAGMGAAISTLRRHMKGKTHVAGENRAKWKAAQDSSPPSPSLSATGFATILLCCFIAEHNLPFTLAEPLAELQRRMFPDSDIAQSLNIKRTKFNEVMKALSKMASEDLASKLRTNKFSIIVDETTDVNTTKCLAVLVKYYDKERDCIEVSMLDMIDIFQSSIVGSTGENLYELIVGCLQYHNIPLENLIGFAADGAANIMGEQNSLCSRLRASAPGITIFKCICHSLHLCASEAAKCLPRQCEDLIRNVYSFFSHSAKRKNQFKDFQKICNLKPHKMLHASQTRWLSLHQAVERILEQWEALLLYFKSKEAEDLRLLSTYDIFCKLQDKSIICYLKFLNFILPKCNNINLLFQRQTPTIHLVYKEIRDLYQQIVLMFCKPDSIKRVPLENIDPRDEHFHVPTCQVWLGSAVNGEFQSPALKSNLYVILDVKERCKKFLITLSLEITKRFHLNDKVWKLTAALNPPSALDCNLRVSMPSLDELVQLLPRLYEGNISTLADEWRCLPWHEFKNDMSNCEAMEFYKKMAKEVNQEQNKKFTVLPQFALQVLSLPTSNADPWKGTHATHADRNFMAWVPRARLLVSRYGIQQSAVTQASLDAAMAEFCASRNCSWRFTFFHKDCLVALSLVQTDAMCKDFWSLG